MPHAPAGRPEKQQPDADLYRSGQSNWPPGWGIALRGREGREAVLVARDCGGFQVKNSCKRFTGVSDRGEHSRSIC